MGLDGEARQRLDGHVRLPSPEIRATAIFRLSYKIESGTPPKKATAELPE